MTDGPNHEYVGVADYDQLHAEAIDALRGAATFFLAVPGGDDEDGAHVIVVRGGGVGFDAFHLAVSAGLNAKTWGAVVDHLQRGRRLRWFMLAAAGANLLLVAWNLGRLLL